MNGPLLALNAFTLTRREMLIVIRYRDQRIWGKSKMERRYGTELINQLLSKYAGYTQRQLAVYISQDNQNIRSILMHISIEEITTLIYK